MQTQIISKEPATGFRAVSLYAQLEQPVRETSQPSVLVVDDDDAVRELLCLMLEDCGYKVLTAVNGKVAVAVAAERQVDVALVDLVMPEQEGLESIMKLRAACPAAKIIAISGAFDGQFLKAARHLGAHAALLKPIRPAVLQHIVASLLKLSVVEAANFQK